MGRRWTSHPSSLPALLLPSLLLCLLLSPASVGAAPATGPEYGAQPRFICTPISLDADPSCFPPVGPPMGGPGAGGSIGGGPYTGLWGMTEEAKTTILQLRESLVQQKETILEQRETIRELTAKLAKCEALGRGPVAHGDQLGTPPHSSPSSSNQGGPGSGSDNAVTDTLAAERNHTDRGRGTGRGKQKQVAPAALTSSEQMSRMLQAQKERLESLQARNASSAQGSLKELLQRKINALERSTATRPGHHGNRTRPHTEGNLNDDDDSPSLREDSRRTHEERENNETDSRGFLPQTGVQAPGAGMSSNMLELGGNHQLRHPGSRRKKTKSDAFQVSFPMRTNYMYGRVKRTLLQEIFAFTLCLWMKGEPGAGLGTPFSYSVPGQANEVVLIEWGNNPMELLVDDKAVTLPLSLGDGKWHHVCVTWSTRDGQWEAYQDGVQRGSGENLSSWHPIKPGGVFILGQEQDTLGGRFDATQSFVGEMSDLQMWSTVLTADDISGLASCGSSLSGDVFAWSENMVELHGGVTMYPFDPCH